MALPKKYMVHNQYAGYSRLMWAPKDIEQHQYFSKNDIALEDAHPGYKDLYRKYIKDLNYAVGEAESWWRTVVDREVERNGSFKKGIEAAYTVRPAGPSSNDQIVSTIRDYWLAVCRIGEQLEQKKRVPPEDFLLRWPDKERNAVAMLTGMPYWPIGLDAEGKWC